MKKTIKITAIIMVVLVLGICCVGIWLHYHPIQDVTSVTSTGVQYPEVTYTPYRWVGMTDKLWEQKDEFNKGVYEVVREKEKKYLKDLNLTYDLDRHDEGGVTVTLYGSGMTKDGKKEEFREVLDFPITLEKKILANLTKL